MNSIFRLAAVLLAMSFASAVQAQAAAPPSPTAGEGISVSGISETKGKPSVVEISAVVAGDAELAADATVKYRDSRRRAVDAINGLKLEGLRIESGGFSVMQGVDTSQMQAGMQGNIAPAGKQRVTVAEQMKLVITGLDKLKDEEVMDTILRVLDTARDAGLQIGPSTPRTAYQMRVFYQNNGEDSKAANLVVFKLPDPDALREQAYKAAMADARKKAERLASLAGVTLGKVITVKGGPGEAELTSNVFKEIPVKVSLTVQFEIAK
jgi:uncharacterized protein YggE